MLPLPTRDWAGLHDAFTVATPRRLELKADDKLNICLPRCCVPRCGPPPAGPAGPRRACALRLRPALQPRLREAKTTVSTANIRGRP